MNNILENRYKIAKIIALAATVFGIPAALSFFGFAEMGSLGVACQSIAMLLALVAYLFGGLVTALKSVLNIAKWGWFLMPFFPVDLLLGALAAGAALFSVFFFPIIPVLVAEKEHAKQ